MVRTQALKHVNYYRPEAITEDMDLAFRLTKAGWIVHQSLIPIKTIVPDTFAKRWKQKKRWNS
jgi:biofilm PGA synthesis N-glycosyltransferase PgaC